MASVEIFALFFRELVDIDAPVREFAECDLIVDFPWHRIEHLPVLPYDSFLIVHEILGAEGLDCERHVHDFCRVSVTGRKVYETAFSDDIYCPAVLQFVCFDVVSCRSVADSHFFQCRHGNFHVEMSCVAADGSVLHLQENALQ